MATEQPAVSPLETYNAPTSQTMIGLYIEHDAIEVNFTPGFYANALLQTVY